MDKHGDAVDKLQRASKAAAKLARAQLKEIAQMLADRHLHSDPVEPLACFHREDGDVEFMNTLANQLAPQVSE
jgi:hypothetical protein